MDDPIGVSFYFRVKFFVQCRAVGRSENPGVQVLFGEHNLSPLVEIGLTVLPKSGDSMAPPGTTGLQCVTKYRNYFV